MFNPIEEFKEDQREVKDGLLDLIMSFNGRNFEQAAEILQEINYKVESHFRCEEKTLYAALKTFSGKYVDRLLSVHDEVIETAKNRAELSNNESNLTDREISETSQPARSMPVHLYNCDSPARLSERSDQKHIDEPGEKIEKAWKKYISLSEGDENTK